MEELSMRRLTLVMALATGAMASAALADQQVTHPFESTSALHGVRRIVIDIPAGGFHIRNGARDTVALHGTVRRSYDGYRRREDHQRIVDDITPEVVIKGDEAVIRRHFGPHATGWSARNHSEIEMTIDVPPDADLDVETHFGE